MPLHAACRRGFVDFMQTNFRIHIFMEKKEVINSITKIRFIQDTKILFLLF